MLDIIYFFGLMLVYVRGCEGLGRKETGEDRP
jgi:hypothetical protein